MKTQIKKLAAVLALIGITASTPLKTKVSVRSTGGVSKDAVEINNFNNTFATRRAEEKNIKAYVNFKTPPVFITPVLSYEFGEENVATKQPTTFKPNKIGMPLPSGLNVLKPLNIETSPVYNYITCTTEQYYFSNSMPAKNGLGYRASLAVELGILMFTASYEGLTYAASANRTAFREQCKMIFGTGLKFGETEKAK